MKSKLAFWFTLGISAIALIASSVLLFDYIRPLPVFCDPDGACGAVRRTIFAYPLGIPMPIFGVAGFLAIGFAQLIEGRRARIAQLAFASVAALAAMGLLVVQASIHAFCPYCAVADTCSILLLPLAIARVRGGWDPPLRRAAALVAVATGLMFAIVLPMAIGKTRNVIPSSVPSVITSEVEKTSSSQITLIDFVDYECPFCRATHAALAPLLAERQGSVRVVRKHVPLRMHRHAMDAARAACCGEVLGKAEAMSDALFSTPPENLTPEGCEALATQLGLDLTQFRDCVKSPAVEARIQADRETFRQADGHGLPTLYVNRTKLEGLQSRETLRAALDRTL